MAYWVIHLRKPPTVPGFFGHQASLERDVISRRLDNFCYHLEYKRWRNHGVLLIFSKFWVASTTNSAETVTETVTETDQAPIHLYYNHDKN
jgi:hypothetical protein